MLHAGSPRSGAPIVCFNCAAVPDTLLETELFGHERGAFTGAWQRTDGRIIEANHGTLFLDEVGEMSLAGQAKLLRTLETRQVQRLGAKGFTPVDVRVVAATNQDLEEMVSNGGFRKDLYYRLNVARIKIPPLRERVCDVMPIARYYLRLLSASCERPPKDFSAAAANALMAYDWPGNVRELKNVIEVALLHEPWPYVDLEHLPEGVKACGVGEDAERQRISEALGSADGNKSKAARLLRCSRMTLYRKMARYAIDVAAAAG
jgi:transcriptional regulator with PAS, ATPase and Fis domain